LNDSSIKKIDIGNFLFTNFDAIIAQTMATKGFRGGVEIKRVLLAVTGPDGWNSPDQGTELTL